MQRENKYNKVLEILFIVRKEKIGIMNDRIIYEKL